MLAAGAVASSAADSVCRRTRTSSVSSPRRRRKHGSGAATMPGAGPELLQPRGVLLALADDRPRAAHRRGRRGTSSRCAERSRHRARAAAGGSGVAAVASTTTRAGWAAAASRSGIVRNGFDGASSQTSVDVVRRGAGLVELDDAQTPAFELTRSHAGPEVRAFGQRDRVAGGEEGEHERRGCAAPDEKSNACPPSSSPSRRSASTPVGCP